MSSLYLLYSDTDNAWVYDVSDMSLEAVPLSDVDEYVKSGASINGVFYIDGDIYYSTASSDIPNGIYRSREYMAYLKGDMVSYCTVGLRYDLRYYIEVGGVVRIPRVSLYTQEDAPALIHSECVVDDVTVCFLPLSDGLYLFGEGKLIYNFSDVPKKYGRPYKAENMLREVLLS